VKVLSVKKIATILMKIKRNKLVPAGNRRGIKDESKTKLKKIL